MTYRNNASSFESDNILKELKEVKIRVNDTYTKTETQNFLIQDNIDDSELYYTKEATSILLSSKANAIDLTSTNTNLSNNYYNKTSTDTLLNAKSNATDLTTTNTNVTNLTNNLSSNYYTKTETENEIDIALETIGSNIVPWNATFNTNTFNFALPYDATFVDATSVLNVNATNYNIVPAKKIYSYVENKVSTSITNALNSTRNYTFGNLDLLFYVDDDATQTPVIQ